MRSAIGLPEPSPRVVGSPRAGVVFLCVSRHASTGIRARDLARRLAWRTEPVMTGCSLTRPMDPEPPSDPQPGTAAWDGTTRELASALRDLVDRLRADQHGRLPSDDPDPSGSPARRRLKTLIRRSARPATRRYDRLAADLATVAADLASRLAEAEEDARKARGDYERLELELRSLSPTRVPSTASA